MVNQGEFGKEARRNLVFVGHVLQMDGIYVWCYQWLSRTNVRSFYKLFKAFKYCNLITNILAPCDDKESISYECPFPLLYEVLFKKFVWQHFNPHILRILCFLPPQVESQMFQILMLANDQASLHFMLLLYDS